MDGACPFINWPLQTLIPNSVHHPAACDLDLLPSIMPDQASKFLQLPIELRLNIYEHLYDDPKEVFLHHSLAYVSDQISEEAMPILLRQFSGFFWTAIPCDEEWYLAMKPRNKIWRMRLINVSELPLDAVPTLHTTVSFHLLVGRRIITAGDLLARLTGNHLYGKLSSEYRLRLERQDQRDGVKRLISDGYHYWHEYIDSAIWFERGRAGAPEMNRKLTERVWHQQWYGGGRRGPFDAWMCRFELVL